MISMRVISGSDMALARFVRNVDDLSDDGGYKFRFRCDSCNDGVESQYVRSSANVIKTGLQVFQMFRWGWGSNAADGIDRGLRGKERDAAYERAVDEAVSMFSKCSHCGGWVCEHCWNPAAGLCERCAPDAGEAAAIAAAAQRQQQQVLLAQADPAAAPGQITCPVCAHPSGGGLFCQNCGTPVAATRSCAHCERPVPQAAKFCPACGTPA